MSEIKVNKITPRSGTTVTLGEAGDTIALAGCASASGFGLSWCSSVKTAAFCAAAGNGYFINTCGGAFEVTLPGSASVGDEINFTDYARTWGDACKALTLNQNSLNFQGNTSPKPEYDTSGATVKIVYSGATKGWIPQLDKDVALETPQTYNVQYLVVAAGGGGAAGTTMMGGGGGAGGLRKVATKSFAVTCGVSYPIVVGGGGTGASGTSPAPSPCNQGTPGTVSSFSTISSAGGGGGGGTSTTGPLTCGKTGGSGGGGGYNGGTGGAGNTPPTPCTQGNPGGDSTPGTPNTGKVSGGGGGHTAAGANGTTCTGSGGG